MSPEQYKELSSKRLRELVEKVANSRALLEEHCDTHGIGDENLKSVCQSMRILGQSLLNMAAEQELRDAQFKDALEKTFRAHGESLKRLSEL